MDEVTQDDFSKSKIDDDFSKKFPDLDFDIQDEEAFEQKLKEFNDPLKLLKRMALRINIFLEHRIDLEIKENGFLSDFTRRWMKDYAEILERIEKHKYGSKKSVGNTDAVSHSNIATKIRKHAKQEEKR